MEKAPVHVVRLSCLSKTKTTKKGVPLQTALKDAVITGDEYTKGEYTMQGTKDKILVDKKKNGKVVMWALKKVLSLYLALSYIRLGMVRKGNRIMACANDLYFYRDGNDGEQMKLHGAQFCMSPLCPICAMRRTRKIFGQVSKIMNYMDAHEKYRYVFLTLTVKNPTGDDLIKTIDAVMEGFHKMSRRVLFKKMSVGWFRALEITHNWVENTYHPHLHMVIAVDEKYFTRYENYVSHEEFKKEWQKCAGLDYEPIVHIQRVSRDVSSGDGSTIEYWRAVSEIAKYTAKSTDYMVMWNTRKAFEERVEGKIKIKTKQQCFDLTDRVVSVLDKALHGRRLVAFGGRLKEVHKLLNLDDPVDGDLVNTDNEELNSTLRKVLLHFKWGIGIGNYMYEGELKA